MRPARSSVSADDLAGFVYFPFSAKSCLGLALDERPAVLRPPALWRPQHIRCAARAESGCLPSVCERNDSGEPKRESFSFCLLFQLFPFLFPFAGGARDSRVDGCGWPRSRRRYQEMHEAWVAVSYGWEKIQKNMTNIFSIHTHFQFSFFIFLSSSSFPPFPRTSLPEYPSFAHGCCTRVLKRFHGRLRLHVRAGSGFEIFVSR